MREQFDVTQFIEQQLQYCKFFNEDSTTITSTSDLNINKESEKIRGSDNSNEIQPSQKSHNKMELKFEDTQNLSSKIC